MSRDEVILLERKIAALPDAYWHDLISLIETAPPTLTHTSSQSYVEIDLGSLDVGVLRKMERFVHDRRIVGKKGGGERVSTTQETGEGVSVKETKEETEKTAGNEESEGKEGMEGKEGFTGEERNEDCEEGNEGNERCDVDAETGMLRDYF